MGTLKRGMFWTPMAGGGRRCQRTNGNRSPDRPSRLMSHSKLETFILERLDIAPKRHALLSDHLYKIY